MISINFFLVSFTGSPFFVSSNIPKPFPSSSNKIDSIFKIELKDNLMEVSKIFLLLKIHENTKMPWEI